MNHTAEITKELFYTIVNEDTIVHEVKSATSYSDIIYIVKGTKLMRRSQQSGANYYIVDINS